MAKSIVLHIHSKNEEPQDSPRSGGNDQVGKVVQGGVPFTKQAAEQLCITVHGQEAEQYVPGWHHVYQQEGCRICGAGPWALA